MSISNMLIISLHTSESFKATTNPFHWLLLKKYFLKNDVFRLLAANKNHDSVLYFFFEKRDDGT